MFRGCVKGTGYPLHSPASPFTSPPVRHRVPSHFNWSFKASNALGDGKHSRLSARPFNKQNKVPNKSHSKWKESTYVCSCVFFVQSA